VCVAGKGERGEKTDAKGEVQSLGATVSQHCLGGNCSSCDTTIQQQLSSENAQANTRIARSLQRSRKNLCRDTGVLAICGIIQALGSYSQRLISHP